MTASSARASRHLPSGYHQVNMAWMWGALLAASMAALAAPAHRRAPAGPQIVAGHGVRGGKAMIATLRWRLIAVPGRLVRHAGQLILRLPPGPACSPRFSPGCEPCPRCPDHPAPGHDRNRKTRTRRDTRDRHVRRQNGSRSKSASKINSALIADSGQTHVAVDNALQRLDAEHIGGLVRLGDRKTRELHLMCDTFCWIRRWSNGLAESRKVLSRILPRNQSESALNSHTCAPR